MVEPLIAAGAAVFVGILSFVGVIITNNRSNNKMQNEVRIAQAVTDERINELTREVREHNNFAHRMPVVEENIKIINNRINDLEKQYKMKG